MTAVISYFVSVLLFLPTYIGPEPNTGWLRLIYPFSDKEVCEQFVESDYEGIAQHFKSAIPIPVEIKEISCLTIEENMQRNLDIGHLPDAPSSGPQEIKPQTMSSKKHRDCVIPDTGSPFRGLTTGKGCF